MNTSTGPLPSPPRGTVRALAATACAVILLAGCDSGSGSRAAPASPTGPAGAASATPAPAVPADKAFDPENALAAAGQKPYAASIKITNEANGVPALTMSGRANLNGLFTGRVEMKSPAATIESVTTEDTDYFRGLDVEGAQWTKRPRTQGGSLVSYEAYAKLLLAAGPAARKGMEDQGGVATYHLSGHLDLEQIASADPRTYASMKAKGVTGFDCDQWIDSQGRTVRFEQRFDMRGVKAVNKAVFADFGPAEKFAAPTGS
ncbi:hypothetical protein [Streptomyces sp. NPDC090445]|uniref:hypothetical protein n=1 Tax=Streptomyces sp. NPDC090445 TaxID=3365963 RepID=UPI003804303F